MSRQFSKRSVAACAQESCVQSWAHQVSSQHDKWLWMSSWPTWIHLQVLENQHFSIYSVDTSKLVYEERLINSQASKVNSPSIQLKLLCRKLNQIEPTVRFNPHSWLNLNFDHGRDKKNSQHKIKLFVDSQSFTNVHREVSMNSLLDLDIDSSDEFSFFSRILSANSPGFPMNSYLVDLHK